MPKQKSSVQTLNLRPGTCFACYGDGGQRISESEWIDCACCNGSGSDCARCWTKTAKRQNEETI